MAKKSKKTDAEKLAELLGIEPPKGTNPYETPTDVAREAEATIIYAESPKFFQRKNCKECGRTFAHTAGSIAYCSNPCRARGLERLGIQWNWLKPSKDRWAPWQEEPLVVPPEALELLDSRPEPEESDPVVDILKELGLD